MMVPAGAGGDAPTIRAGGQDGAPVQFARVRVGAVPVNGGSQGHIGVIVPAGVTIPVTTQISTVRAIAGVQEDDGR